MKERLIEYTTRVLKKKKTANAELSGAAIPTTYFDFEAKKKSS